MRADHDWLEEMVDALQRATAYLGAAGREEFMADNLLRDAISYRLAVAGEAAKQVSEGLRVRYPGIPWRDMAGMRDILVHGYYRVEPIRIWNTVRHDCSRLLPELRAAHADSLL